MLTPPHTDLSASSCRMRSFRPSATRCSGKPKLTRKTSATTQARSAANKTNQNISRSQGRHPVTLNAVNVPFAANVRLRSESDRSAALPRSVAMSQKQTRAAQHSAATVGNREFSPAGGAADDHPLNFYSMILSALTSRVGEIVRPSALAVFWLIHNSSVVGNSTGKSAGLAPFNILST